MVKVREAIKLSELFENEDYFSCPQSGNHSRPYFCFISGVFLKSQSTPVEENGSSHGCHFPSDLTESLCFCWGLFVSTQQFFFIAACARPSFSWSEISALYISIVPAESEQVAQTVLAQVRAWNVAFLGRGHGGATSKVDYLDQIPFKIFVLANLPLFASLNELAAWVR